MLIGFDMQSVEVLAMKQALSNSRSVFTERELRYSKSRVCPSTSLAGIFCSKEAFIKAVNGVPDVPRFTFTDVEVLHSASGRPRFAFGLKVARFLEERHFHVDVTITHAETVAGAVVLLWNMSGSRVKI